MQDCRRPAEEWEIVRDVQLSGSASLDASQRVWKRSDNSLQLHFAPLGRYPLSPLLIIPWLLVQAGFFLCSAPQVRDLPST
jgi:hypothetical protein